MAFFYPLFWGKKTIQINSVSFTFGNNQYHLKIRVTLNPLHLGSAPLRFNTGDCRRCTSGRYRTQACSLSGRGRAGGRPGRVCTPARPRSWCRAPGTGGGTCCRGRRRRGRRQCWPACSARRTEPRSWCRGRSRPRPGPWWAVLATLKNTKYVFINQMNLIRDSSD